MHDAVETHFRPEFVNRLNELIVFRYLERDDLKDIVALEMAGVAKRMKEMGMDLELQPDAAEFLIDKGYNQDFGARPLRRAVEQYVEYPVSEEILRGRFTARQKIVISAKDGRLKFTEKKIRAPRQKGAKVPPLRSESSPSSLTPLDNQQGID